MLTAAAVAVLLLGAVSFGLKLTRPKGNTPAARRRRLRVERRLAERRINAVVQAGTLRLLDEARRAQQ